MSKPTKEQIEKVLAIGRRFETGLMAHRLAEEIANLLAAETAPLHEKTKMLMHDLAGARGRIDELHGKIAHLEKRLTGALQALQLSERRRNGVPLSGEVNEHELLALFRPVGCVYRVLRCKVCQSEDTFGISLADNGQWNLECGNCHETAAILTKVLAELR